MPKYAKIVSNNCLQNTKCLSNKYQKYTKRTSKVYQIISKVNQVNTKSIPKKYLKYIKRISKVYQIIIKRIPREYQK